jgi:hypothetical protein
MFNLQRLKQRIDEFGGRVAFGREMGLNSLEVDSKLCGNGEFTLTEISRAVEILKIEPQEIPVYFFNQV